MQAPEPYLVTDEHGKILAANLAASRFLGAGADGLKHKPLQVLIEASRQRDFRYRLAQMIPSDFLSLEVSLRPFRGGESRHVVLTGLKTLDSIGRAQVLWLVNDLTDRVLAEEAVRRANAELEERVAIRTSELEDTLTQLRSANATKDEFLGLMSHELRTPLTVILGNARLLANGSDRIDKSHQTQALQDIASQSERLQHLIENLMVLARLDTPPATELEPIMLQHLIPNVMQGIAAKAPDLQYSLFLDAKLPPVQAVTTYCEQILENLISNAIKYSASSPVEISARPNASAVTVAVRDHGPGVSAEDRAQVFEPFYRGKAAVEGQSGAGIGLTVCKRLVEAQGGTISVAAPRGGGAEFRFTLQVANSPDS
jgi:PAS domain S-box-containing protein